MRNPIQGLVLFFLLSSFGVMLPAPAAGQQKNFNFNQVGIKDGLSHGIILSICKDRKGFMWLGTWDGLNRFDGTEIKVFKHNRRDPHSLASNTVFQTCTDSKDALWCGTGNGVSRYDPGTETFTNFSLPSDSLVDFLEVPNIICDRKGRVWCTSANSVFEFIPDSQKFVRHLIYDPVVSGNDKFLSPKNCLVEDPYADALWIASYNGLIRYNTADHTFRNIDSNPEHRKIFSNHYLYPLTIDRDRHLVYSDNTAHERITYDVRTDSIVFRRKYISTGREHKETDGSAILCDSRGNTWSSYWSYTLSYDEAETGNVFTIAHDPTNPKSVNSDFFWQAFEDEEGTIWIGGINGLSSYNPAKELYRMYRPDKQFEVLATHNNITQMIQVPGDSVLYFGARGAGLFSFNQHSEKFKNFNFAKNSNVKGDRTNTVYDIAARENRLWLGTDRGVRVFDRATQQYIPCPELPPSLGIDTCRVLSLAFEADSVLWLNMWLRGLVRVNLVTHTTEAVDTFRTSGKPVPGEFFNDMHRDPTGSIWVTTYRYGVLRYNPDIKKFRHYPASESDTTRLGTGVIFDMAFDAQGYAWVVVKSNGISRLDTASGEVRSWSESDGLAFNHTLGLTLDNHENVWIASYNNLSVFDPKTETFTNVIIEFAESDYQYVNSMATLSDGTIVMSLLGAFARMNPANYAAGNNIPPVLIGSFKIFERELPGAMNTSKIMLRPDQNFFSVSYSVLTGVDRNKLRYAYKLEGYDNNWVIAGSRQLAAYTNVPGGDYTFRVKAFTGDLDHASAETRLPIHIATIYYKAWWFRLLLILAIVLILFQYLQYRDRERKRMEAEEAVTYFSESIYGHNSVDDVLWDLTRNVVPHLGFTDCVVYLFDPVKNVLVQKAAMGTKNPEGETIINPIEIEPGKGIVGSVAQTRQSEIIADTSRDARYVADDAIRLSEIAVPVIIGDQLIGVIDSEHHAKNFFKSYHLRILETIASVCGAKIVKARARMEAEAREKELLEFDKKVAEVRLTALQAQMNPHFIFNCLNAIDNFILKNQPEEASRYLNQFARLIRSILSGSDKKLVSLRTEIELLKNYAALENLRFEEKFECIISGTDAIDLDETEIPPMLIQPFVENAILHGLAPRTHDKRLSLSFTLGQNHLECIIEDNGIGREAARKNRLEKAKTHESKGMNITVTRFELLKQQLDQSGRVEITDLYDTAGHATGTRVRLTIPVEIL